MNEKPDVVNQPPHYTHLDPEPLDLITGWRLTYLEGNVVKYLARHRHKNGKEDLLKAQFYLNRLIKDEYGAE